MSCLTTDPYTRFFRRARLTKSDRLELVGIFIKLADFIHQHGLEQIVSIGPSGAPFAKHVAAAYRKRHSKPLRVVNLGQLGEALRENRSPFQPPTPEVLSKIVTKIRGNSKELRSSLVFDEAANSGMSLHTASQALHTIGLPHKTAVLLHNFPHELYPGVAIDFPPKTQKRSGRLAELVGNAIGISMRLQDHKKSPRLPALRRFVKRLHADLREVVERVPKRGAE